MGKPSFVYVTYIQTTPETLWNALLDPEMTKDYWGRHRNVSDWKTGSAWRHEDYDDANNVRVVGTVLESNPPHRLVLSWASPEKGDDPAKQSRVTFDIEPYMGEVRLTVTHEDLDNEMLRRVSGGWPAILSSLKTLLETGKAMPMTQKRWSGKS
ncbi:SRPBCC family protein [Pseudorhodoplanes sinuspersici]|uniref:Polyketide cyclase n=1 Tax=Pseudorhodoplanes sinuspersici TaxID=1235591 RepID=A0A1W6ZVT1_9HYPH|nr:SRPBCC family protein [Pseudorhodoplanes sinuspersici]ARQ01378.1 polyketide cyclase [Pseudorhodoplanes sinuspersici]RKE73061.1 uncharacterized protein YndB with AHSA1/START domain [Pseudorhodoplanes sinuspersici]